MTNPGQAFPRPSTPPAPANPQGYPAPAAGGDGATFGNGSPAYPAPDGPYRAPNTPPPAPRGRPRRSVAWVYYGIIAIIAVFAAMSTGKPAVLIAAALSAAYAVYIFRGGRFVIWIW